MRVVALCMIVLACGIWGIRRAGRLSGRVEQIMMAIDTLRRLQGYMIHWKRELRDALVKAGADKGLGAVLKHAGERMADEYDALPGSILTDTLEKAKKDRLRALSADDWSALNEFFSALCYMDSEQAGARFGFILERLHMNLEQARAEQEKKARLFKSLGWMAGLAVALLLA